MPKEDRKSPRLLSINYSNDTNRALAALLRRSGYEACTAGTLKEAEQMLSAEAIDLILCQITASDGDGAEFVERIYKKCRIPSLAVAGSLTTQSRAARLSRDAMRGILAVPVDLTTMLAAIKAALARSGRRAGVCPDCQGQGIVLLLTSKQRCQTCKGTGLEDRPTLYQRMEGSTGSRAG